MEDNKKELYKALLGFHKSVGKIIKDGSNPAFKKDGKSAKYATLTNVQDAIREPLEANGLIYTQVPKCTGAIETHIIHAASGQELVGEYPISPVSSTPQAYGSAITYAKRYSLVAMLGLSLDDDDDGNAASQPQPTNTQSAPAKSTKSDKAWLNPDTEEWTKAVKYLKGNGTIAKVKEKYAISKVNESKLLEQSI